MSDQVGCSSCHGSSENAAPPRAVHGPDDTSYVGVGAHQSHVRQGTTARRLACSECHPVPTTLADGSHPSPTPRPAEVVFGALATADGARPTWNRTSFVCTNGYCHGATLQGAETRAAPVWIRVDGTHRKCTSCHGYPPAGTHPSQTTCEACHGEVMGPQGTVQRPELHVNGTVELSSHGPGYRDPGQHGRAAKFGRLDCRACHGSRLEGASGTPGCDSCHQSGWRSDCTFCHGGTDNQTGAPPVDLAGNTASSLTTVGAHSAHVSRTSHPAYPCSSCHPAVTDVLAPGHLFDSTPGESEVWLGGGLSPAGQYSRPGCENVYCHGNGRTNGSVASFVPQAPYTCESCHPSSGLSGPHAVHLSFMNCSDCHGSVVSAAGTLINPDLHVDGSVSVVLRTGTWTGASRTCSATGSGCHGGRAITW